MCLVYSFGGKEREVAGGETRFSARFDVFDPNKMNGLPATSPPSVADVDLSEGSVQDVLDLCSSPSSSTLHNNDATLLNDNDANPLAQMFEERFGQLFVMCETILKQQVVLGAEHARLSTELATMREQQQGQGSVPILWAYLNDTMPRVEHNLDTMSKKIDLLARGMGQIDDKVSPLITQTSEVDSTVKEVHQTLQEHSTRLFCRPCASIPTTTETALFSRSRTILYEGSRRQDNRRDDDDDDE